MALKIVPTGTVQASIGRRFTGKTLADVAKEGGLYRGEAAATEWELKPKYYERAGQIVDVDLTLIVTMEMPAWINYSSRPKAEKDEWDRFYKALRYHEDAHHALLKREASAAYAKLRQAKTGAEFESVFQTESDRIQRVNGDFDLKVAHGKRQTSPYGNTIINI